jgi:hypothetical protein
MTKNRKMGKVPVVGYVEGSGNVHFPKGCLEDLEKKVKEHDGEQVEVTCPKCGHELFVREKRWTGICDRCQGKRDDELDKFDCTPASAQVLDRIRSEMLKVPRMADTLTHWNKSGDILDVSILQKMEPGIRGELLYRAPDHLPHVVVIVDKNYACVETWIKM